MLLDIRGDQVFHVNIYIPNKYSVSYMKTEYKSKFKQTKQNGPKIHLVNEKNAPLYIIGGKTG